MYAAHSCLAKVTMDANPVWQQVGDVLTMNVEREQRHTVVREQWTLA